VRSERYLGGKVRFRGIVEFPERYLSDRKDELKVRPAFWKKQGAATAAWTGGDSQSCKSPCMLSTRDRNVSSSNQESRNGTSLLKNSRGQGREVA